MSKNFSRNRSSNLAAYGDATGEQVSVNWKYATFVGAGLLVAQFLWWNAKAPEVFNPPAGQAGQAGGY